MYRRGTLVTLINSKSHYDGQETLSLVAGTCGLVVQVRNQLSESEREYVVDFGAYGQWNCLQNELQGDNSGAPEEDIEQLAPSPIRSILEEFVRDIPIARENAPGTTGTYEQEYSDIKEDSPMSCGIDFEADLARRVKELEKEIK